MNKDLIKKIVKKIEKLEYYNKKYYSENTSVTDANFDKQKDILDLEKKYKF